MAQYILRTPPIVVNAMQNGGNATVLENWMKLVSSLSTAPQLTWRGSDDYAVISANADGSGETTAVAPNVDFIQWDATDSKFIVVVEATFNNTYQAYNP